MQDAWSVLRNPSSAFKMYLYSFAPLREKNPRTWGVNSVILKNLISNSFRYFDPLKSENHVVIEGQVNEQQLTIKITDNGIGIEEKHLPRIYDMFYRAVEHSQGTGIGLFLVRETVRMLRGKIAVKSKLGEWTIFYLTIPNLKGNASVIESAETPIEHAVVVNNDQSVG